MNNYALGLPTIISIYNISAASLAKDLKFSKSTVYDWINQKKKLSSTNLKKLSDFFKIPEHYFISELSEKEIEHISNLRAESITKTVELPISKDSKSLLKDKNLILLKNSGKKSHVDEVVSYMYHINHSIPLKSFVSYYQEEMKKSGIGSSETGTYHKTVLPRYFGLLEKDKNNISITSLGKAYHIGNIEEKIEVIFTALQTLRFGRYNNAVSSNSDVEAPLMFLKSIVVLGSITLNEFGCLLYLTHNMNKSFAEAIETLLKYKKENKVLDLRDHLKELELGKYFDPKFNVFFTDLGIVSCDKKKNYTIPSKILSKYRDTILNFDVIKVDISDTTQNICSTNDYSMSLNNEISNSLNEFSSSITTNSNINVKKANTSYSNDTTLNKSSKFSHTKNNIELDSSVRSNLGWNGEKLIFDNLKNSTDFLSYLNLKENEVIEEITWYNEGFEIIEDWVDKSIGYGHDILIKTNLRLLYVEVKTSYGSTSYSSATTNELKLMFNEGENYYLFKISNFKNWKSSTKKIDIIIENNPIESILNINRIKELVFYVK